MIKFSTQGRQRITRGFKLATKRKYPVQLSIGGSFQDSEIARQSAVEMSSEDKLRPSGSSGSNCLDYLLIQSSTVDEVQDKAETLAGLIKDGHEIFNGFDFQILTRLIAYNDLFAISALYDLLSAMVTSDLYQKRIVSVIEATLLYSKHPESRYTALELLSEAIECHEVQDILNRAKRSFAVDDIHYVRDYFNELCSLSC